MNYKERIQRAFPAFRQWFRRVKPFVRVSYVTGAVAGTISVTDIKAGDQLVSVVGNNQTSGVWVDHSADFIANTDAGQIVRNDGEIDNTGGTSSAGELLQIVWISWV